MVAPLVPIAIGIAGKALIKAAVKNAAKKTAQSSVKKPVAKKVTPKKPTSKKPAVKKPAAKTPVAKPQSTSDILYALKTGRMTKEQAAKIDPKNFKILLDDSKTRVLNPKTKKFEPKKIK